MPRLAAFYGIVIWMYRPDHPPPHFHARYGEHDAKIELDTLRVIDGHLPTRALRLVRQWARLHPDDLQTNWHAHKHWTNSCRSTRSPSMQPMVRVTEIEVLGARTLRVRFDDGACRDVDCSFLFHGPLGEPLRDPDYFRLAQVDPEAGTVSWPNGLDPAPELLHGDYDVNALAPQSGTTRAA